jgi:hypothetical protein
MNQTTGPCPGKGLCCNRPEFDRALFPCSEADQAAARTRERASRYCKGCGGFHMESCDCRYTNDPLGVGIDYSLFDPKV